MEDDGFIQLLHGAVQHFWFILTCEYHQDGAEQQVDGRLPPLWHASHNWWYQNLCWNVKLQGEGDENTKAVQQLHSLVCPGNSEQGRKGKRREKGRKEEKKKKQKERNVRKTTTDFVSRWAAMKKQTKILHGKCCIARLHRKPLIIYQFV